MQLPHAGCADGPVLNFCVCTVQAAILAAPDYAEAHNNLGVLFRDVGEVSLSQQLLHPWQVFHLIVTDPSRGQRMHLQSDC